MEQQQTQPPAKPPAPDDYIVMDNGMRFYLWVIGLRRNSQSKN